MIVPELEVSPAALAVAIIAVVAVAVLAATIRTGPKGPRDPRRQFSAEQRRAGFARASGRCEFGLWRRCNRPALHGDHWFPHARGGSSSMANFVAACPVHNLAKSDRMPSSWHGSAIANRRRAYFPVGDAAAPGAWYGAAAWRVSR